MGILGMIDPTITLGNVIEIISIIGGGLIVLITLKNNVAALKSDVGSMQIEIKKLGEILINQADMRGEIKVINARVASSEQDIRELRHGRGFVQHRSQGGVDGEYP